MSSGGFTAAYKILAPKFESETGVKLVTAYGASSGGAPDSIPERLKRGQRADVVILSQNGLNALTRQGFVQPDSHIPLANSMIGLAVRAGTAVPDIATKPAFIETLLAAESIGYSASASGTYLSTKLFPALGIWDRIKAKSVRIESERVAAVVARGDVQIGFQQISEILPIDGVTYVGPIPPDVQKVTLFSAGLTHQDDEALAWIFVCYLTAPEHGDIIQATGLTPAPSTDRLSSRCGR